jgi:23S rRNA (uracil1939-C5)-methyltransferase
LTAAIKIESLAYHGAGVGRNTQGKTVFVAGTVPGDIVETFLIAEKDGYDLAEIAHLAQPSPHRISPTCAYTSVCGGCPWQIINYEEQLIWKRQFVIDALQRIGGFSDADNLVEPCKASPQNWAYRNKIEFAALAPQAGGGKLQLGLHANKQDEVVPVDRCLLFNKELQDAPKKLAGALGYALKDAARDLLRVGIRTSRQTKDLEVAIWMLPSAVNRNMVAKIVGEALPTSSVVRVISGASTKERRVKKVEVLAGNGFWRERIFNTTYMLSAPSFFQVNTAGAGLLVEKVLAFLSDTTNGAGLDNAGLNSAGLDGAAHVLDLYCGAGTFTLPLAQRYEQVSAVESAGSSLRDLRRNLANNALNADVIGGDVARELPALPHAQAAVIDPPRAGLSKEARAALACAQPEHIVYVSCNPATLARDLRFFAEKGWRLVAAAPFDLFPQTYHIETAALLSR